MENVKEEIQSSSITLLVMESKTGGSSTHNSVQISPNGRRMCNSWVWVITQTDLTAVSRRFGIEIGTGATITTLRAHIVAQFVVGQPGLVLMAFEGPGSACFQAATGGRCEGVH